MNFEDTLREAASNTKTKIKPQTGLPSLGGSLNMDDTLQELAPTKVKGYTRTKQGVVSKAMNALTNYTEAGTRLLVGGAGVAGRAQAAFSLPGVIKNIRERKTPAQVMQEIVEPVQVVKKKTVEQFKGIADSLESEGRVREAKTFTSVWDEFSDADLVPKISKSAWVRVPVDLVDPIGNELAGGIFKQIGKGFKYGGKLLKGTKLGEYATNPIVRKAVTSEFIVKHPWSNAPITKMTNVTNDAINTLQHNRFLNLAVDTSARVSSAINYPIDLMKRAIGVKTTESNKAMYDLMMKPESGLGKKYNKMLDDYATALHNGDTIKTRKIANNLKAMGIISPDDNIVTLLQHRDTIRMADDKSSMLMKLAYASTTGELSDDILKAAEKANIATLKYTDNGEIIGINKVNIKARKPLKAAIDAASKGRTTQLNQAETLKLLGTKTNILQDISMAQMMAPSVATAAGRAYDDLSKKILDPEWLLSEPKEKATSLLATTSHKESTVKVIAKYDNWLNSFNPGWATMDEGIKQKTLELVDEIAPFFDDLPELAKTNAKLLISHVGDAVTTAKNSKELVEKYGDVVKILNKDPVKGLEELRKIDYVKDYLKQTSITNNNMLELYLKGVTEIDPELAKYMRDAIYTGKRGAISDDTKKILKLASKDKKTLAEGIKKVVIDKYKNNKIGIESALDNLPDMQTITDAQLLKPHLNNIMQQKDFLGWAASEYNAADNLIYGYDRMPGYRVDKKIIKKINKSKTIIQELAIRNGINPDSIPALSKFFGWQDDAYGRLSVDLGLMKSSEFEAKQGFHLRRGYKLLSSKDLNVEIDKRLNDMAIDISNKNKQGIDTTIEQHTLNQLHSEWYNWQAQQSVYESASQYSKSGRGGIGTTAYARRLNIPNTLAKEMQKYDDISAAWFLSNEIGGKNVNQAMAYNSLANVGRELGIIYDTQPKHLPRFHQLDHPTWGALNKKWVEPWLHTKLQNMVAMDMKPSQAVNWLQNMVSTAKAVMLSSPITYTRNLVSNALAIEMNTDGPNFLKHTSAMLKGLKSLYTKDEAYQAYSRISPNLDISTGAFELEHMNDQFVLGLDNKSVLSQVGERYHQITNRFKRGAFGSPEAAGRMCMFHLLNDTPAFDTMSVREKVLKVEQAMIDYHDVPAIVDILRRRTGIAPFITYSYKMAGNIIKHTVDHPDQVARFLRTTYNWNNMMSPNGSFEDEVEGLPDSKKTWKNLLIKIPTGKNYKDVMVIDATYFLPHGLFALGGRPEDPGALQALSVLKGFSPLLNTMQQVISNQTEQGDAIAAPEGNYPLDVANYLTLKTMPGMVQLVKAFNVARGLGMTGEMGQRRIKPEDWWTQLTGVRRYDIDEEYKIKYTTIQKQWLKLAKDNASDQMKIIGRENLLDKGYKYQTPTQTLAGNRAFADNLTANIQRRSAKMNELAQKMYELSKEGVRIQNLRTFLESQGHDKETAKAYDEYMVDNSMRGDQDYNWERLVNAMKNGDWTQAMSTELRNAFNNLPEHPTQTIEVQPRQTQPMGVPIPAGKMTTNKTTMNRANKDITSTIRNPLLPPSK